MPKYALFFTYSSEAWAGMIERPPDREAAARASIEAAGGTMESIYWMFGPFDGIVIYDAPDAIGAAALSAAVGSTGAFKHLETHELLNQGQLTELLRRAKEAKGGYRPPGE